MNFGQLFVNTVIGIFVLIIGTGISIGWFTVSLVFCEQWTIKPTTKDVVLAMVGVGLGVIAILLLAVSVGSCVSGATGLWGLK